MLDSAKVIEIVTANRQVAATIGVALQADGFAVVHGPRLASAGTSGAARIVELTGTADAANPLPAEHRGDLPVVALCDDDDVALRAFNANANIHGVFGLNEPFAAAALAATVGGIVTHRGARLPAYLGAASLAMRRCAVASYEDKKACFDELFAFVSRLGCFAEFPDVVLGGAWETVMNATLDAPAAAAAAPTGAVPRPVEVQYGTANGQLLVTVEDTFGTLARADLTRTLARCHRQGDDQISDSPGGAGIGLYMLFHGATQVHFTVRPGHRTRVALIFQLSRRYREFSEMRKTLSYVGEV